MIGKNAGRQASSSGSTLVESTPMIRQEAVDTVPPEPGPKRGTQLGHNEQQTNEVEDKRGYRRQCSSLLYLHNMGLVGKYSNGWENKSLKQLFKWKQNGRNGEGSLHIRIG